jgi:hypothetical protein
MLRGVLLGIGVAGLLVAVGYLAMGLYEPGLQLLVIFPVLTAGIAFERWRYVRNVNRGHDRWQATGERFVDPTTPPRTSSPRSTTTPTPESGTTGSSRSGRDEVLRPRFPAPRPESLARASHPPGRFADAPRLLFTLTLDPPIPRRTSYRKRPKRRLDFPINASRPCRSQRAARITGRASGSRGSGPARVRAAGRCQPSDHGSHDSIPTCWRRCIVHGSTARPRMRISFGG